MLIGDRGGPTTKIAVVPVCKKGQNNSPKNCMILALWQGNDDRQSLEKVAPLFEQLATIKAKWSVSFILIFKKNVQADLRWFAVSEIAHGTQRTSKQFPMPTLPHPKRKSRPGRSAAHFWPNWRGLFIRSAQLISRDRQSNCAPIPAYYPRNFKQSDGIMWNFDWKEFDEWFFEEKTHSEGSAHAKISR